MNKYEPKSIESKWPASAKATAGKQKYEPKEIESHWQEYWEKHGTFEVKEDSKKRKFYGLIEFPYPSGAGLHVGHPRSYTAMDVIARKRRMEGFNVLYPIGFDSFGLPTENFAIKTGRPPAEITEENIANFTRQLKALGFSFDWSRAVTTSEPEYYQWTQWIFLQLYKHGLAYKKKQPINWCPKDKIGLANEEVVDGKCERCGGAVEKRDKEQWMLAITKYADKLLDGLKHVDYIERAKLQQENWIGRSEGAEVVFKLRRISGQDNDKHSLTIFTTRPDTMFGATFVAISPELAKKWLDMGWQASEQVRTYIERELAERVKGDREEKEKTGIDAGFVAVNPANGEEIPVWVANYVMGDVGTGAIMAVPAHDERDFEFAKKFGLSIKEVVAGGNINEKAHTEAGKIVNSDLLNGLTTFEAKTKMIAWLEEEGVGKAKVQYKLRDWVFSRQRYWGEPIPLVWCDACSEWIPLPEKDLPLKLPEVKNYQPTDTGESPLAAMTDWVNTKCPKCKGPARRETDTMPNWAGSSWYFLRYCDPKNKKALASPESLKYWMNIDWYNGGMEHTVLHLLYSRFWNLFLHDIGVVPTSEPYQKRTSHGMILANDGQKMSKSLGNVVNPDEMVEQFGADALRTYIMFMGPFDQAIAWDTNGLIGVRRFLDRVWFLQNKVNEQLTTNNEQAIERLLHQTIKKVTEDIEEMRFNTAIAKMMELVNEMNKEESISKDVFEKFVLILSPFAPHMAEELWEMLGNKKSVALEPWPTFDPSKIIESEMTLAIQVNGKLRDTIVVAADVSEDEVKKLARGSEKVQKWLEGTEPKKVIYVKGKLVSIVV